MNVLSNDEITNLLLDLPLWQRKGEAIEREIVCSNFASAVGFVNAVAILAETLDHHPDILLYGWNKIRISSTTHSQGGLTEKDFALAKRIEELKF